MLRHRLSTALVALALVSGGTGLLLTSAHAADCPAYTDPAGDSGPSLEGNKLPLGDDDLDIRSFSVSSSATELSIFIKVANLAASPTLPFGDEFELNFKLNDKTLVTWADRFGGALGPVASALHPELHDPSPIPAKATYTTATDTVTLVVTMADLDKAAGGPSRGKPITGMVAKTYLNTGALVLEWDAAAAPATASHVVGTTCTVPAAAAPEPTGDEEPSEEPSGEPSDEPSACDTPEPGASPSEEPTEEPTEEATEAATAEPTAACPSPGGSTGTASRATVRASATTIYAGQAITLSGTLKKADGSNLARQQLHLYQRSGGQSVGDQIADVVTDDQGAWFLNGVRPIRGAQYYTRYDGSANEGAGSATSNTVQVNVRAVITVTSPRSGTTISRRTAPVVVGTTYPGSPGATIGLQMRSGSRHTQIAKGVVRQDGAFEIRRYNNTPLPPGTYTLQVTLGPASGNSASASKEFILYVR